MAVGKSVIWCLLALVAVIAVSSVESTYTRTLVKKVKGKKLCMKEDFWECNTWSEFCCNETISDIFQVDLFEKIFKRRNWPVAKAVGFWDYHSFITAAAIYEPLGFGTTGGKLMQMKEIAAFLGHVGAQTSCGYGVADGGPTAWGLCYNRELSPSQSYCDEYFKFDFPCAPGASYYGRGALPVYWNYNYGAAGNALKLDLLNHPEYIEQNATMAFQVAIWKWMTPVKRRQPSAHDVFVGKWKPTKNDTLAKRVPGFGATMNILYGEQTCGHGHGDLDEMNSIISHYLYYLENMGFNREEGGDHEVLTCAEQRAFNPNTVASSS